MTNKHKKTFTMKPARMAEKFNFMYLFAELQAHREYRICICFAINTC